MARRFGDWEAGLILGSQKELPVGERIVRHCSDPLGIVTEEPQPILILREATYEEWVEDLVANGGERLPSDPSWQFYYQVSTD